MAREKKPGVLQDAAGLAKGRGTALRNLVRKPETIANPEGGKDVGPYKP